MSRHSRARDRSASGIADTAKMGEGATVVGDNDANAGLGIAHAMDSQQTENSLNRAGVTDTLGMPTAERLGRAVNAGAALSETERQQARGIVAGHTNQFAANRFADVLGAVPVAGQVAGLISNTIAKNARPPGTMENSYREGRALANDTELGAVGEAGVGYGLAKAGISAPMGFLNAAQATVRDKMQNSEVAALRDAGFGSETATGTPSSPGSGGSARSAIESMASRSKPNQPQGRAFGWHNFDMDRYRRTPFTLASS